MHELVFAKELLPLFDGRPVIKHSIDALRRITSDLLAIVNPNKKDLIKYLKTQSISFIRTTSTGLPHSIHIGAKDHQRSILVALPDTFYQPEGVFVELAHHPKPNVIGLFRSSHPDRFDSVKTLGDRITRYAIKTNPPLSPWTMGCLKLSPETIKLLKPRTTTSEPLLGDYLQPLIKQHLLHALKLKSSSYFDLGTPSSYIEYLLTRFHPSRI
jgi:dTDP-glucose pyrophosphorylase